ncbi:putative F-box protein At3g47150 [Arachis ipaensis]|uniref:F-box domain-containing protein n=1 Tax=Arachis hypogaea TaxID=3818 RepID=A0A445E8C9_ARAHY|nr:putative F-box protein At3g47150 [Arachis ipaensis]XP_025636486.1 putative F-box protein At3g47150 [Arachis hypogaea]RYR71774.1 hypothetical protein Ahy_A02g005996 [Arachis hypogaea]
MESPCDTVIQDMDLLTEILLRLPVKQVIQCKCVCKKWLSIISNPKFRYSHTCHLYGKYNIPPPTALLVQNFGDTKAKRASIVPFHTNNNNANKIFFHLDPDRRKYMSSTIIHSCNGLLLCNVTPTPHSGLTTFEIRLESHFRICNPAVSNDHCVYLDYPLGDVDSPCNEDFYIFDPLNLKAYLVFEPLKQPLSYKVILFGEMEAPFGHYYSRLNQLKPRIGIRLYSSETSCWSSVVCNLPNDLRVPEGVYCNDSELLCVKYLGECKGRLHLILSDSLEFDIWELEEDYSSWVARYRVNLNRMHDGESALCWNVSSNPFSVLSFVLRQEEEEEDSMLVLFKDGKIMSYSLKNYGLRVLCKLDKVPRSVHHYFETLLCVGNS